MSLNLIHKWICKQDLAHIQRHIGSMINLLNGSFLHVCREVGLLRA